MEIIRICVSYIKMVHGFYGLWKIMEITRICVSYIKMVHGFYGAVSKVLYSR